MKRIVTLGVLIVLAMQAEAQGDPVASPGSTLRSTANLVLVPALVLDRSGEMIHTLTQNDFALTDNGIPQKLTVEHIEHQPVSVVVLMQTGGAAPGEFAYYKGLGTMLDNLVGETSHKVALVTFDSQPEELWNFPPRGEGLSYAFTHPDPGDGGAAILDAISYSVDLLKQQPDTSRRVILLISQQHDAGSRIKPEAVVRELGESNTTIYSLTFSPAKKWFKDQFTGPRHGNGAYDMPGEAPLLYTFNLSGPLFEAWKALQQDTASEIAALSGGESLHFSTRKDLEEQLSLLANRIPNRYTLSFRPTSNEPGFHELKVQVLNQPEPVTVSARTSYWSK
ncbi:hypothetical protein GRAN_2136 [Granulicella sibirica]|uniref:VWFA domain-containing protein n=1 Tax=Granulicella sibirica TaxID=2479048 RepID=A0A4Q0TAM1_9BACT|nr:hypothetical protein GRAN_2136 [Granulicella sibirica]